MGLGQTAIRGALCVCKEGCETRKQHHETRLVLVFVL
jgi:hypothetical protein